MDGVVMAETTKAFKVSDEFKDRINAIIKASGLQDKEWIETVTNLWIMQDAKAGLPGYGQDISELELHTKRINELFLSMIQRTSFEKDDVLHKLAEMQEENSNLTESLELATKEIKTLLATRDDDLKKYEKEKEELERLSHQMEESLKNNTLLIEEYKEKNDTLTGLVNEYRSGYERSNELVNQVNQLNQVIHEQEVNLREDTNKINALEKSHKSDLERLVEKKDLEKERELLKLQADYQIKLQAQNEESTIKLQSLYERIEELRKEHQAEIQQIKEDNVKAKANEDEKQILSKSKDK
jgi:DNA repair exonuclease SbcCD ATPase subunit